MDGSDCGLYRKCQNPHSFLLGPTHHSPPKRVYEWSYSLKTSKGVSAAQQYLAIYKFYLLKWIWAVHKCIYCSDTCVEYFDSSNLTIS